MPSNSKKNYQIRTIEEQHEVVSNNNSSFPELYERRKTSPESRTKRSIRACRCDWWVRGSEPGRDWSGANPRVGWSSSFAETPKTLGGRAREVIKISNARI